MTRHIQDQCHRTKTGVCKLPQSQDDQSPIGPAKAVVENDRQKSTAKRPDDQSAADTEGRDDPRCLGDHGLKLCAVPLGVHLGDLRHDHSVDRAKTEHGDCGEDRCGLIETDLRVGAQDAEHHNIKVVVDQLYACNGSE